MRWTRNGSILAVALAALTGTCAWEGAAQALPIDTVACYVALANDLTPLVDATRPDSVTEAPECARAGGSAPATLQTPHESSPPVRRPGSTYGPIPKGTTPAQKRARFAANENALQEASMP